MRCECLVSIAYLTRALYVTPSFILSSGMADSELASKLSRQNQINEGEVKPVKVSQSVYAEFKEFSIQEIKEYRKTFQK